MASGFTSSSLNYPLLAIPAYYIFSVTPHIYTNTILSAAGYKVNNANPRASLSPSAVSGKVPADVFARYQRAEAAQSNNLESLPLFAAAVLASVLAERVAGPSVKVGGTTGIDPTGLTTFVASWFALRAAYNVAYIAIADHQKSYVRSGIWASGVVLAVWQVVKAAQVLG